MDFILDATKDSKEPEWVETIIIGDLRLWQLVFLCMAVVISLMVMVCCCFRFRIPRTKQQIEADYQRRKITTKFRQQLETIQDSKMDAMSLKDVSSRYLLIQLHYTSMFNALCTQALDLLHEKKIEMDGGKQEGSQPSSIVSPQQSSLDASFQPEGGQKPEPQVSGINFVKFATKVANLSKLGAPKSPTSPTALATNNKMDF